MRGRPFWSKSAARLGISCFCISVASAVAGCGTFVPDITEPILGAGSGPLLVRAIVQSIHCELRGAVTHVIDQDKLNVQAGNPVRTAAWFDDWGVQIGLTLRIEESSAISANGIWTRPGVPSAMFTLGAGGTLSALATREDKLNYYYTVAELYQMGECPSSSRPSGNTQSLLVRSDLKLRDWLDAAVLGVGTGAVKVPTTATTILKQNALSHQVRFQVVSSGEVTPAWDLRNIDYNKKGAFLAASRNRVHDLLTTFGPVDPKQPGLVGAAADAFLASQIAQAVHQPL